MTTDYLNYYDLEGYLFRTVHDRFHRDGKLNAFDLFSIIVWKANRSKSRLAQRLTKKSGTLEESAEQLTKALANASSAEQRLHIAMTDWGFYLPMASAILTVLWPEDFTIYDVRVCEELGAFGDVNKKTSRKSIWDGYCAYRAAVAAAVPWDCSLRDKDRFLWGRSAARQLQQDIAKGFAKPDKGSK